MRTAETGDDFMSDEWMVIPLELPYAIIWYVIPICIDCTIPTGTKMICGTRGMLMLVY